MLRNSDCTLAVFSPSCSQVARAASMRFSRRRLEVRIVPDISVANMGSATRCSLESNWSQTQVNGPHTLRSGHFSG